MTLQIVDKSGDGLSRLFAVTVPAGDLASRLEARIAEVAPKMNIKGFRPGKVPLAHVRRLYGQAIMGEIVQDALNETTQKVLEDHRLRPAGQPNLTPSTDMGDVMAGTADLAYDLSVDVMPEFIPMDVASISLVRPVYVPSDTEVDEALAELAKQAQTYEPRKGKATKAKTGDQLLIDFIGRIDGEAFEGGTATDSELVLGSGQFIPGFEDQLVGAKPGAEVLVAVDFPADYQAERLRGKAAEFTVTVKEVRAPVEAQADDSLAVRLGMSDLDALKAALRSNLEAQYGSNSRFKLKRALLDALDKGHDIPLPPAMVDAEFQGIWQQVEQDRANGQLPEDEASKDLEDLRADYMKIAQRRVRLGLVLAEIGRLANVVVTEQELTEAMRQEAMRYGPQAQQVFEMYRQNANAQAALRAPIYEEKVVDLILAKANVTDQAVTKEALLEEDDLPEAYKD